MTCSRWMAPLLVFMLVCSAAGSRRSQSVQEVPLPSDYGLDFQMAVESRSAIMSGATELTGTPYNQVGDQTFQRLVGTGFNLPYSWRLTIVNNQVVNASASPAGQVYVFGGILPVIGTSPGLWAAVLSHEIIHSARRHQVQLYVERVYIQRTIDYYRNRIRQGDKSANWVLAGYSIAAHLLLNKMERDQEHQADQEGMLLMAQAGYHPDYVFALHHLLVAKSGDQSKFAAFFSDHPRWATRDQRDERTYTLALTEFKRLWPDAALSPGGAPPAIAFLGRPKVIQKRASDEAEIAVPFYCRNAGGPVDLTLAFERAGAPLLAANPAFADKSGSAIYTEKINCDRTDPNSVFSLHVPGDIIRERSAKAVASAIEDGTSLASSQPFDVKFPKMSQGMEDEPAIVLKPSTAPSRIPTGSAGSAQKRSSERSRVQDATEQEPPDLNSPVESPIAASSVVSRNGFVRSPSGQTATMATGSSRISGAIEPSNPGEAGYLGAIAKGNRRVQQDGVPLFSVIQGSPADIAGLRAGDVIEKIDETHISSIEQLMTVIAKYSPGSHITIQYRRGTVSFQTYAILGRNPDTK